MTDPELIEYFRRETRFGKRLSARIVAAMTPERRKAWEKEACQASANGREADRTERREGARPDAS